MQNLSDFQWKVSKQGGKVREDRSDLRRILIKKLIVIFFQFNSGNIRIKEVCVLMLISFFVLMGYFQKLKDFEEGIYIQFIVGSFFISLYSEKYMLEEKGEVGM